MFRSMLVRELLIVLAIKLLILSMLWWFFIRDQKVSVDSPQMAQQINSRISGPNTTTPPSEQGTQYGH